MEYSWKPHPGPQTDFLRRGEFECLFGGAAGPGKSECALMDATRYVNNRNYRGLVLRRTFPQLEELMDRALKYYPLVDPGARWMSTEKRWHFSSGATIKFGHMQTENDKLSYQGQEYHRVYFDEVTQFTPTQYLYVFSRVRTTDPNIRCAVRCTTNPGGISHQFIKDRFCIGTVEPRTTIYDEVDDGKGGKIRISRVFIPATLDDNPSLANDTEYLARLAQLPELERLRLRHGLWDAFEGQAFTELNKGIHGIKAFDIPLEWERFRAFDWGYAKPFSVGWYAVDFDGNVYRYAEWYGAKRDEGRRTWDCGMKMTATEIARGIKEREREMRAKVRIGPADPAIWSRRPQKDGTLGISVSDEMGAEGIYWLKADNDRILGRQQVHHRLSLDDEGHPSFYVFDTCEHWWRVFPQLRENEKNPEDIEDKAEDHPYDETRYALMFKPVRPRVRIAPDIGSFQSERRKYLKAKALAAKRGISIADAYRAR